MFRHLAMGDSLPPAPGMKNEYGQPHLWRQSNRLIRFGEDEFVMLDYQYLTGTYGTAAQIAAELQYMPIATPLSRVPRTSPVRKPTVTQAAVDELLKDLGL